MRRFRFVGDPEVYLWDTLPVVGKIYDGDFIWEYQGERGEKPLQEWFNDEPEYGDWQEVHENEGHVLTQIPEATPKPLHKDTDLGMFSAMFIASGMSFDGSIEMAKLLIIELDKEVGGE